MNKPNPAPEPTMEEILASIRRIISDGDDGGPPAAVAELAAESPEPEAPLQTPAAIAPAAETSEDELASKADTPEPDTASEMDIDAIMAADDFEMAGAEDDADIFDLTDDMVAEDAQAKDAPEDSASVEEPAEAASEPEEAPAAIGDVPAADAGAEDIFDKVEIPEDELAVAEDIVDPDALEVAFDDPKPAAAPAQKAAPERGSEKPVASEHADGPMPQPGLLSPQSDAMVASAFGRLANTILNQDPRTLEDLVGEMLRPMLKDWLDDNLPVLVEKLVREEIERVSRGRR